MMVYVVVVRNSKTGSYVGINSVHSNHTEAAAQADLVDACGYLYASIETHLLDADNLWSYGRIEDK